MEEEINEIVEIFKHLEGVSDELFSSLAKICYTAHGKFRDVGFTEEQALDLLKSFNATIRKN